MRGGFGTLVHEVRNVAPAELGDAELEPGRRHEEHLERESSDGVQTWGADKVGADKWAGEKG